MSQMKQMMSMFAWHGVQVFLSVCSVRLIFASELNFKLVKSIKCSWGDYPNSRNKCTRIHWTQGALLYPPPTPPSKNITKNTVYFMREEGVLQFENLIPPLFMYYDFPEIANIQIVIHKEKNGAFKYIFLTFEIFFQ